MKLTKLPIFLTFITLPFYGLFGQDSIDNEKIEMLREFYRAYTIEVEPIDVNWEKVDSIKAVYFTKRLIDWHKNAELDYDPFINAQDLNPDLYKILKISRDNSTDNKFIVSYNYYENEPASETKIELIVIKVGNEYKIDQVLID